MKPDPRNSGRQSGRDEDNSSNIQPRVSRNVSALFGPGAILNKKLAFNHHLQSIKVPTFWAEASAIFSPYNIVEVATIRRT